MPSSSSSPGFFSSRKPVDSPRDLHRTAVKRKPLHERTKSENNSRPSSTDRAEKSTVRLIDSSTSSLNSSRENSNPEDVREGVARKGSRRQQESNLPRSPSPLKPKEDVITRLDVSNDKPERASFPRERLSGDLLRPRIVEIPASSSSPAVIEPPRAPWHRRSGSSGVTSDASTLYLRTAPDGSLVPAPRQSSDEKHQSRTSLGTTLHGTPTPYEQDRKDEEEDGRASASLTHPLHTLPEASPEREAFSSGVEREPRRRRGSRSSLDTLSRPQTSALDLGGTTQQTRRKRKSASTGSVPSESEILRAGGLSSPPTREDLRSIASSDVFNSPPSTSPNFVAYGGSSERSDSDNFSEGSENSPSSPNFIAYSSPSVRPKSGRRLQGAPSFESIESRLQYPAMGRSDTMGSLAERSSLSSSPESLPPLRIPKKTGPQPSMAAVLQEEMADRNAEDDEEIDTLPYPRQAFSMHLSTIASESDRSPSRHWSQFSAGSGVLTGGEESSMALPSRSWQSPPLSEAPSRNWMEISSDQLTEGFSSDDELGEGEGEGEDMSMGIYREESAKPLPLFKQRRGGDRAGPSRPYDGPLPPMPPIPGHADGEEDFDQVSDLYPSRLQTMRSGQSLRQRSNSTPSQSQSQSQSQSHSRHMSIVSSYQSSERPMSNGSGVFPYWAKQYYANGVGLMSASKISLTLPTPPPTAFPPQHQQYYNQQQQLQLPHHARGESEWTDITTNSRIQSSYMDYYDTDSPPSSHFLPSIFRPRTRLRLNQTDSNRSMSLNRSAQSQFSSSQGSSNQLSNHQYESRPDSMTISTIPPLPQDDSMYAIGQPHSFRPGHALSQDSMSSSAQPPIIRMSRPTDATIRAITPPQPPFELPADNVHYAANRHPLPHPPSNQTILTSTSSAPTTNLTHPQTVNIVPHAFFQLNSVPHLHTTKRSAAQGLSPWRAPSFTDSLDTLVRSKGNRQILLFVLGFLCPLFWVLGAVLPVPDMAGFESEDEEKAAVAAAMAHGKSVLSPVPPPIRFAEAGQEGRFAGAGHGQQVGAMSIADSLYATSMDDVRAVGALPARSSMAESFATTNGGRGGDIFRPATGVSTITGTAAPSQFSHRLAVNNADDDDADFETINEEGVDEVAAAGELRQRTDPGDHEVALLMMLQHQAEQEVQRAKWAAEKVHLKAKWWRTLNRIMSFVGVGIIGAIIALAVVASTH